MITLILLAVATIEACLIAWLALRLREAREEESATFQAFCNAQEDAEERHKGDLLEWIQLCARQDSELERLRAMCAGDRRWLS